MIKVERHGNRFTVANPAIPGQRTEMINVVFVEHGRAGANAHMNETSDFLSSVTGAAVGLDTIRVHTHPVRADQIHLFPVGKQLPGFINRSMYSTPQIQQQEGAIPRVIDGKITYFITAIQSAPKDDRDERMSVGELLTVNPDAYKHVQFRPANVELIDVVQGFPGEQAVEEPELVGENQGGENLQD